MGSLGRIKGGVDLDTMQSHTPRNELVNSRAQRWDWGGFLEGPVIPNLRSYDWSLGQKAMLGGLSTMT